MTNTTTNKNKSPLQVAVGLSPSSSSTSSSSSSSSFEPHLLAQSDPGVVDVVAETTETTTNVPPPPLTSQQLARLEDLGFTKGLAQALYTSLRSFPHRLWMADNYQTKCTTPWEETKDCVAQFGRLAHLMGISTDIHAPAANESEPEGTETSTSTLPLTQRLTLVQDWIPPQWEGRVALVITTDSLPFETPWQREEFCQVLLQQESKNLFIVFRLCSDDWRVTSFYKHIDKLYTHVEVLDDYASEAKDVFQYNPWLNYSLALHRLREVGFSSQDTLNLLDERPLTKWEIYNVCCLLFGRNDLKGMSDATGMDWDVFVEHVARLSEGEEEQWNPIAREFMSVVSLPQLKRHGKRRLFEMCMGCTSPMEWNLY